MATYIVSDDIRNRARRLKTKFPHNLADANLDRIVFLMELDSPSKTKLALTKKIDAAMKVIHGNHDYIQIYFQKRWENLNEAQRNILVLHELMHCQLDGEKLRKHDVEEFYEVGAAFGINWPFNEAVIDPLSEEFNQVLQPKPADEPDAYAEIMEEDHGIQSNISSQYREDEDDQGDDN